MNLIFWFPLFSPENSLRAERCYPKKLPNTQCIYVPKISLTQREVQSTHPQEMLAAQPLQ